MNARTWERDKFRPSFRSFLDDGNGLHNGAFKIKPDGLVLRDLRSSPLSGYPLK